MYARCVCTANLVDGARLHFSRPVCLWSRKLGCAFSLSVYLYIYRRDSHGAPSYLPPSFAIAGSVARGPNVCLVFLDISVACLVLQLAGGYPNFHDRAYSTRTCGSAPHSNLDISNIFCWRRVTNNPWRRTSRKLGMHWNRVFLLPGYIVISTNYG